MSPSDTRTSDQDLVLMDVEPPQLLLLPPPSEGERPGDELPDGSPHHSSLPTTSRRNTGILESNIATTDKEEEPEANKP